MSYELNGVIRHIEPEQTFASGFSKREFVVTTDEKYPQDIKLEFVKDKTVQLDRYRPGDRVRVAFNFRGNEYRERFYVNLVAWKIETESGDQPQPAAKPAPTASSSARQSQAPCHHSGQPARQDGFYGEPDDEEVPF
ncbi:MAG: DUF3127 domain-containing protein [Verrucomicrobiota bacterium]